MLPEMRRGGVPCLDLRAFGQIAPRDAAFRRRHQISIQLEATDPYAKLGGESARRPAPSGANQQQAGRGGQPKGLGEPEGFDLAAGKLVALTPQRIRGGQAVRCPGRRWTRSHWRQFRRLLKRGLQSWRRTRRVGFRGGGDHMPAKPVSHGGNRHSAHLLARGHQARPPPGRSHLAVAPRFAVTKVSGNG